VLLSVAVVVAFVAAALDLVGGAWMAGVFAGAALARLGLL
jgi:hypothetical protein